MGGVKTKTNLSRQKIMLGQLKDRFLSLQEEISSSVKQLAPSELYQDDQSKPRHVQRKDLDACADLLESWQNIWEDLHLNNEHNAKSAVRCDKMITLIRDRSQKQHDEMSILQSHVPRINSGVKEIMEKLGSLESFLGDVEIALLALEDTIDAREMQEKQLDQRFQLAMYQERRKAEFNELATRLQNEYEKKKKKKLSEDRHKQQQYYQQQSKFEENDVQKYS